MGPVSVSGLLDNFSLKCQEIPSQLQDALYLNANDSISSAACYSLD